MPWRHCRDDAHFAPRHYQHGSAVVARLIVGFALLPRESPCQAPQHELQQVRLLQSTSLSLMREDDARRMPGRQRALPPPAISHERQREQFRRRPRRGQARLPFAAVIIEAKAESWLAAPQHARHATPQDDSAITPERRYFGAKTPHAHWQRKRPRMPLSDLADTHADRRMSY